MRFLTCVLLASATIVAAAPYRGPTELTSFFEENRGQFAPDTLFASRTRQGVLLLTSDGHALLTGSTALRYRLLGARRDPKVVGIGPQSARAGYFLGNQPSRWRAGVTLFDRVEYRDPYPGIRMIHYRNAQGGLEHDFLVAPGADVSRIRFRLEGAQALTLSPEGDLIAETDSGAIIYRKPIAYQEAAGQRRNVEACYQLSGDEVTFRIDSYDRRIPLVIDPVVSLPVSHGGGDEDWAFSVKIDAQNNVYITGVTLSPDFPVAVGVTASPRRGGYDAFVLKLAPNMRTVLWTAFLGGSMDDFALDLVLDPSGAPIVAGHTVSPDFPTRAAPQTTRNGVRDAFIAKFAPADGSLVFSTYFGGNGADIINGVTLDASGNIVAAGGTTSTNFPTTAGALFGTFIGGIDCFVSRFNATASQLIQSTLFGGNQFEICSNIEINAAGDILVAGTTTLSAPFVTNNFPTTNTAVQRTYGGGMQDGFLARINPGLSQLLYSTYIGGSGDVDEPDNIHIDPAGNAWVGGRTNSANFPLTANAAARTFHAPFTGWVAGINTGSTAGPRAASLRRAAGTEPEFIFPMIGFSSFTPVGKKVEDVKIIDNEVAGSFAIVVILFENADGSAYTETHYYAINPDGGFASTPFSVFEGDFIVRQLACSSGCAKPSSHANNAASKQQTAASSGGNELVEYIIPGNDYCTIVGAGYTFPNPLNLKLNQVRVAAFDPGAPPGKPSLSLIKKGPFKVCPDVQFYYEVVVTNSGTGTATDVRLQDDLPAEVSFIRASTTRPAPDGAGGFKPGALAICTRTGARLDCPLGDIPPKSSRTVYIIVTARMAPALVVTNTARVGTLVAKHFLKISAEADVFVNMTGPKQAAPGAEVTYIMTVGNNGRNTATNLVLTDTLPKMSTNPVFTHIKGACVGNECKLAMLAPGDTWEVRLRVRLSGSSPVFTATKFRNTAFIKSDECDPFPPNSTFVETSTQAAFADILGQVHQVSLDRTPPRPKAELEVAAFNAGVTRVQLAQLVLDLPSFATAQVLPPDDVNCSRIGMSNDLLCNLGLLARGQRKAIHVNVTTPDPMVDYYVEVRAGAELPDPDLVNNRNQALIEVSAPQPSHTVGGVSNSAKPSLQTLVVGEDPALFGAGFSTSLIVAPPGESLPLELGGAQVMLNDIAAPLFFVTPNQINFQVPWELLEVEEALLRVVINGRESYAQQMHIAQFDPGIFTANQSGSGQGSILIAGTPFLAAPEGFIPGSRPARRGEFLAIYCNGLGLVNDLPPSGAATPSDKLYQTLELPTVTIGGVEARVVFSGLAPGFVGLYQVNVEVPAGAPVGDAVPLVLTIGDVPSNNVTIAVAAAIP